jgi:hypothetical protein
MAVLRAADGARISYRTAPHKQLPRILIGFNASSFWEVESFIGHPTGDERFTDEAQRGRWGPCKGEV